MIVRAFESVVYAFASLQHIFLSIYDSFGVTSLFYVLFFFGAFVRFIVFPFFGVRSLTFRSGSSDTVEKKKK